jgi:hypothetical protein
VPDVDRAAVDHPQERHRAAVLAEDHRAGQVELDLRLRGHVAEFLRRERVERGAQREEASDLAQSGIFDHGSRSYTSSPRRCARCTASVRLRTPSLRYTALVCSLTVCFER